VLIATILLMAVPVQQAEAATYSPLFLKVEGPTLVSVSEMNQYTITGVGGPAESGGNYSFAAYVTGSQSDFTGFVRPLAGVSARSTFLVNVTAPNLGQTMTLFINMTSTKGLDTERASTSIVITVVNPIVISARVVNQGSMGVSGVPVKFLADGKQLYNTTIDLAAGESRTLVYNWTAQGISSGEHLVTVELDPNGQFVRFASGGTLFTQTIFVGGNDFGNINLLMVMMFILLLVLAYFIYKRPTKKKKKK
jgi:hypothetical protein